jgi:hypothetical protein
MSSEEVVSDDKPSILESHIATNVKKLKEGALIPFVFLEMVKKICRTTSDEFYLLSFEDDGENHSINNTPCELCTVSYSFHRPADPCELSIQEATENNALKAEFKHPTRCSDCGVLLSKHSKNEDAVVDKDTDDLIEEEEEEKLPLSSSGSFTSTSSSSSTLSTPSSSTSSSSPASICRLSYDEATRFCTEAADFLRPCNLCSVPNLDHPRKASTSSSSSSSYSDASYRLPSMDQFPKFRDPKDKQMLDPSLFFNRLERAFDLYSVPDRLKQRVLIACVKDELMQKWVEDNIVAVNLDWSKTKDVFTAKYTDAQLIIS